MRKHVTERYKFKCEVRQTFDYYYLRYVRTRTTTTTNNMNILLNNAL